MSRLAAPTQREYATGSVLQVNTGAVIAGNVGRDRIVGGLGGVVSTEKVAAEIGEIDARLASKLQRSAVSEVLSKADPGAAFLNAPVDVQRAVLRTVATVTVMPAVQRGRNSREAVLARIKIGPVTAV